ncbi:MAG: hypothetical protein WBL63_06255 [Candidatus Acidiferrum sp.]
MRIQLTALAFFALLAQPACAAVGRVVTLVLPHPLHAGDTAWIELKVGAIERGAEIEIATTEGRTLGVISPFGIPSGHQAGTYTIPLPADAISNDRVSLRLTLNQHGHAQRAPTAKEVKSIRVKIRPAG